MKGLLYKDFVNGKGYIAVVIFYLSYVMSMIGALSYEFINAEDLMKKVEVLSDTFPMMISCIFVACIIPMSMATALCNADNKTKWNNYALALPGGYRLLVAEKYVIVLIGHVISVVSSLLITVLINSIYKLDVEGFKLETDVFIMLMLLLVGISLLFNAILLPFIVRDKGGWINVLFVVIVVIVLYAGFAYIALGDTSFFRQENLLQKFFPWISRNKKGLWQICYGILGVGIVSQIISYCLTVKNYFKYS